ncbi:hypothetical protein [Paraburkholderia heleia]|uniref:hypothetical protein n=1 Tax=Paraburkholderia heleia TaxID=634127 RepID=UPI002AB6AAA1|nr:hypothetical protein [Paraburkholderia heleia]
MKTLLTGLLLPAAEVGLGWFWLAGGHNVAGRVLTFYWWLIVAMTFGAAFLLVLVAIVKRPFTPHGSTRASRLWFRALLFARVIAQVAIGCTSLAVFSLAGWLFAKFALLLATDEKKAVGA